MKRSFCALLFLLLILPSLFSQCVIPVVASVNPQVICQGEQVQLSAYVTPVTCGVSAGCFGNNISTPVGSGNIAQPGNITQPPTLLGNFSRSARNQMLYLASELTPASALGGPCIIKRISFNLAIFNSSAWLENFTVKIGCTNLTSLSTWENNLTTVFFSSAPGFQPTAVAWNNSVSLSTPFAWDGVSNLIVDVCWNNPITFGNQNNKAECTNTAFNSYLHLSSNTDLCGTTNAVTPSTLRPNVQFNYCYTDINEYNVLWTPNTGINAVADPDSSITPATPQVTTSYIITVNDGAGCAGADTVIVQVDNSRVNAGADIDTCPGNLIRLNATLIPTIIPGPPVYTWTTLSGTSVGSGQSVNVNPTVTTTYVVSMNGGGCIKRDTVTINIRGLNASSVKTEITCSTANDGKIKVLSDGNAPFTYIWSVNANTGSVDTAVNLQPGLYSVTVIDANGCSGSASATLPQPPALSFTSIVSNATCFGGNNGSITINSTGGTGTHGYLWSNGIPPGAIASSLTSGNYSVTVNDANQCTATGTFVVSQPTQIVFGNATIQDVRCFGGNTGRITTTPSGGTGGYTYRWSHNPGLNADRATNLTSGSYTVTIFDQNLCTATATYSVTQPAGGLTVSTPTFTPPTCFAGNNGTATANPNGGVTPYTYLWNNPSAQTTQTATGLSAQTYNVTVTDDSLCTASASVNVTQPPQVSISGNVTNVKCNGGSDGAIDITITNGVASLSYLWNPGGAITLDLTAIAIGNYSVTVTDNTGCTQTASFVVTEPPVLVLNPPSNITNVLCFGNNTGSITANSGGGATPYVYSWNNAGTTPTISSLIAGTYIVTLTDANLCSVSASYQITEPAAPLVLGNPTIVNGMCSGQSTGSITVNVSGGTAGYNYLWNPPANNSATISSLLAGNYSVTVTDANSCTVSDTYSISEPVAITFSAPIVTNASCFGYNDGSAEVFPSGGVGGFSYTWNGTPGSNPQVGLIAGNYIVSVTDGNGCVASTTLAVTEPAMFVVNITPQNATCFGAPNGIMEAVTTGGTLPVSFLWSNGTTNQNATGLSFGEYSVTATDLNGCSVADTDSIRQPLPLTFFVQPTQVKCPGDKNGTIEIFPAGGTAPYNYSVTQDGSNFIYSTDGVILGLASGYYTVIVADDNGCTLVDTTFVPSPVPDTFDYTTDSTSCYGAQYTDGAVHVQGLTIQNMPYQFGADGGALSYSGDLYNLTGGNHVINAVNNWGCKTNFTVTVPQPPNGVAEVFPEDTTIQLGESLPLYFSFSPFPLSDITSYFWSPSEGLSCADCPNPMVTTYNKTNQYTLTITYNKECVATASMTVSVQDTLKIFIPNSFSPNGDGNNDEWLIYGEGIKTVDLKIFNRWGEKVFATTNPFDGWDGSYKGAIQNPSVFVYNAAITFLNDRKVERLGSIMLLK